MFDIIAIITNPKVKAIINVSNTVMRLSPPFGSPATKTPPTVYSSIIVQH